MYEIPSDINKHYEKQMRYHWGYGGAIVKLINVAEWYDSMPLAKKIASFAVAFSLLGAVEIADRLDEPKGCSGSQDYKVYGGEPFDVVVNTVATNITLETGSPISLAAIRDHIMAQNNPALWETLNTDNGPQLVAGATVVIEVPELCN